MLVQLADVLSVRNEIIIGKGHRFITLELAKEENLGRTQKLKAPL